MGTEGLILLCLHLRRIKPLADQQKQMAGFTVLSHGFWGFFFCSSLLRSILEMRFACAGKEKM